ncbi:MAG: two-component sensor histidine kinase [Cyclobacteriaceae bacterium]|nr:MAG: two-component sensor histidine kinase [Cyclobacteriaceae bacterium]
MVISGRRMKKSIKDIDNFTVIKSRNKLNYLILALAIFIGVGSIYYSNIIASQLQQRERDQIHLFAKTLETIANDNSEYNENVMLLFEEIVVANETIPVIVTHRDGKPKLHKNVKIPKELNQQEITGFLNEQIEEMRAQYAPIIIANKNDDGEVFNYEYIFYKDSFLLTQLQYYPYVQLSVIAVFFILSYLAFSYSRAAEQNRVWVGLAKETAHQLGTPLSSLMAWWEYLKSDPDLENREITRELGKDIKKLEMITNRFSSIGSVPVLQEEDIFSVIRSSVNYLQTRISTKVIINVHQGDEQVKAAINKPLFDWVIENLCKNSVDAMSGVGVIDIYVQRSSEGKIIVDIADTGKGIPKNLLNQIFQPGFTTKKRGWGLGLTLAKRIVEHYHKGKIFIKSSELNTGTTFRILLNGAVVTAPSKVEQI